MFLFFIPFRKAGSNALAEGYSHPELPWAEVVVGAEQKYIFVGKGYRE